MRNISIILLLSLIIIILMITRVDSNVLSSSTIKKCVVDGTSTSSSQNIQCNMKLSLLLNLNSNQGATEQIKAVVYEDGTSGNLSYPIQLSVTKSAVFIQYPLIYEQTVSNKPYETVIYKRDDIIMTECQDSPDSSTCGRAVYANGTGVRDSQGFCCTCIFSDYFLSPQNSRANLKCTLLNDRSSSAHCLSFDKVLYNVYDIQLGTIIYTINVTLSYQDPQYNFTRVYPLTISPSSPTATDPKGNVIARIIGSFATDTQLPTFESKKVVMVNKELSDPTNPRTQMAPINSSLILEEYKFGTGDQCNTIGVSYSGFQNQPNRCQAQFGECLNNQIDDHFNQDAALMAKGLKGNYILSNFGSQMFSGVVAGSTRFIRIQVNQNQQTEVQLELKADSLQVIMNTSPGKIIEAYVKTFEAMSNNGVMLVSIQNTGVIIADYEASVVNCSKEINPITAQSTSLGSKLFYTYQFDITTQTELKNTYFCYINLKNGNAQILDSRIVYFNVSQTNITNPQGTGTRGGDNLNIGQELTCDDYCPNFFQLLCFISQAKCLSRLVITIAALVLIVIIIIAFIKSPLLRRIFCCCCCRSRKNGGISSKDYKKQRDQDRAFLLSLTNGNQLFESNDNNSPPPIQKQQPKQQKQQQSIKNNNNLQQKSINNNNQSFDLDSSIEKQMYFYIHLDLTNDQVDDFEIITEMDMNNHQICLRGLINKLGSKYQFKPVPATQTLFLNQVSRKEFLNNPTDLIGELHVTNLTRDQINKLISPIPKQNYIWINKPKPQRR